jgi:hypothetical protein
VARLQAALQQLQVLQPSESVTEGLFDAATEEAVKRFQWFAGRVQGALSADGAFVHRATTRMAVDGVVGARTRRELAHFAEKGWSATGLLVRVAFASLQHTCANTGFAALLDGNVAVGLCERDFAGVLAGIDDAAARLGIFVFVNRLFSVEGQELHGPVMPPASLSAHKIGRAVSLQLGGSPRPEPGHNPQPSNSILQAAAGAPFARFLQHLKGPLRCRYGGDFDPADTAHFDHQILPAGAVTWHMHYFFDQLQYRQALVNPAAIPEVSLAGAWAS